MKLKLTLCDTVGFEDQVNKEDSFGPVVDYVDNQFEAYLQGEILPIYKDLFINYTLIVNPHS